MKQFLTICLIVAAKVTLAVGGIWVLELEFTYQNHAQTGYIQAGVWADNWVDRYDDDTGFTKAFHNHYHAKDTLTIFKHIIDREALSTAASFTIHPFFLVDSAVLHLTVEDLLHVKLRKVWKKMDYHIVALTPLTNADTSWISGKKTTSYPLGQEVGCRLEVHHFSDQNVPSKLLGDFVELYKRKSDLNKIEQQRYLKLLDDLKSKKVVVVELCGC